jgi:hypothetical protein
MTLPALRAEPWACAKKRQALDLPLDGLGRPGWLGPSAGSGEHSLEIQCKRLRGTPAGTWLAIQAKISSSTSAEWRTLGQSAKTACGRTAGSERIGERAITSSNTRRSAAADNDFAIEDFAFISLSRPCGNFFILVGPLSVGPSGPARTSCERQQESSSLPCNTVSRRRLRFGSTRGSLAGDEGSVGAWARQSCGRSARQHFFPRHRGAATEHSPGAVRAAGCPPSIRPSATPAKLLPANRSLYKKQPNHR